MYQQNPNKFLSLLSFQTPVDVEIMRRREVKWLEMLTQWDAYMLRNYRKVTMVIMITIMQEQKLNGDENVITSIIGTWALSQRNPTEYKSPGMASPLWSEISGNSHYTLPFTQQSSHRKLFVLIITITIIVISIIITNRWRTPKTVKLSAVCGAAASVSRGGSMTSRKIFTGSVQLILIIMIIIDQGVHCDCQELPHTWAFWRNLWTDWAGIIQCNSHKEKFRIWSQNSWWLYLAGRALPSSEGLQRSEPSGRILPSPGKDCHCHNIFRPYRHPQHYLNI